MNPIAALFLIGASLAILGVSRRNAPIPLLIGTCYMTTGQGIEIAGLNFPIIRILLLVGLVRVACRNEWASFRLHTADKVMLALGSWLMFASLFHEFAAGSGPIYTGSLVLNITAIHFLIRVWVTDYESTKRLIRIVAIMLVPIALEMCSELLTGKNAFGVFGRVSELVLIRDGKLRAQGPFPHPILAGTVGAVCFPLFITLWRRNRMACIAGMTASILMVAGSNSSGPILSLAAGMGAVGCWPLRNYRHLFLRVCIGFYLLLELAMSKPAYYLMGRINLTGSSTGYHRARLIETTIDHFPEWWLFGTDYTRHWMPTGVSFSPNHTDITNYYISFGVNGGIVAIFLVIWLIWLAFNSIGRTISVYETRSPAWAFDAWCIGCSLFANAVTSVSVAYFGQSLVFFWMPLALCIGTLRWSDTKRAQARST